MKSIFFYIKNILKKKDQYKPIIISNDEISVKKSEIRLISKFLLCLNSKKKCFLDNLCLSCHIFNKYKHPDYFEIDLQKELIDFKKILNFLYLKNVLSEKKVIVINMMNETDKKKNIILKMLENPPRKILFLINSYEFIIEKKFKEICNLIKIKKKYELKNFGIQEKENLEFLKFLLLKKNKQFFLCIKNEGLIKIFNLFLCILFFFFIKKKNIYIKNLIKTIISYKQLIKKKPGLNKNLMFFFIKKQINYFLFSSL